MGHGVWIFAEHRNGEIVEASLEVISEGRRLADQLGEELSVVLLGSQIMSTAELLGGYGADTVFVAEDAGWTLWQPESYVAVLAGLVRDWAPRIFLMAATSTGEDLATRLAARLRVGLSGGCERVQLTDDGSLLQTCLAMDNKIQMTVTYNSRPQLATLRPGIIKVRKMADARMPAVVRVDPARYLGPDALRMKVVGTVKADPKAVDIADAEIIVAGGRGVGSEGFSLLAALADLLGGAVAGSRMAVDAGWIGRERQIGQSGKKVSPDLLISCGISGASAHTIGMRDARTVIAINKDANASMIRLADLGVVGDFHEVAPVLIDRLQRMMPRSDDSGEQPWR